MHNYCVSMADELRHVYLDPKQIRVLAHPLRSRLIGELRLDGPATATRLAEALGTNTGATSYHLRQLAEAGLVEEDQGAGRGRERVWRAAHDVTSWQRNAYADDPDATAAADWLTGFQVQRFADRAEAWQRAVPDESAAWRDAAGVSDYFLTLSAGQLDGLLKELDDVVERHRRDTEADPAPDARQVSLYLGGMPRVEPS
jgi:DNA-binding transcriptional ArsR family regulator